MNIIEGAIDTRIEISNGINGCNLIKSDSNGSLASLEKTLDFSIRRETDTISLILTDLTDKCENHRELYARLAASLINRRIKRIIGVGQELMQFRTAMYKCNITIFADEDSCIKSLDRMYLHNEPIVVFGHLPNVSERIEAQRNESVLEINLDHVIHNYNFYKSHLKESTGIIAMVKAQAYGAGAVEISKTLRTVGVSYLAVATTDEASELRNAGINVPIIVLNPRISRFRELFANNFEPELYSLELCRDFIAEAQKNGIKNFPVHIKLDTGMHRVGFLKEQLPELIEMLKSQDAIVPCSVFAHLAVADCITDEMDEYTRGQLAYFEECSNMLMQHFPNIMRHHLNTAGCIRFTESQYDMVRLGIGLYGTPILSDNSDAEVRQAASLRTKIISIKEWDEDKTIGYGRRGTLNRRSVIATIPIGYADGMNRHLSNRNYSVLINGVRCPIIGNICMDACMVDVTDVPNVHLGDDVEIFGEHIPVSEMSDTLGTITYEVLTSISPRVKRIYTLHL